MPAIFAGLGLADVTDEIGAGESPKGREVLFLIDGLGDEVIAKYAEYIPTLSTFTRSGRVQTAFPSTTATSLATLTTGNGMIELIQLIGNQFRLCLNAQLRLE